jgi:serine/threonine protein kinase
MELFALREISTSDPDLHEVDVYYLEGMLQKGKGCTRILKASSSECEETLTVKLFPKSSDGQCCPGFITEERSLTNLSHPNLLKYHSFYKDALIQCKTDSYSKYSAIIMEYVPSGDLFNFASQGPLSEKLARTLFKQMVSVIEYLHSQQLAHLDIKLENFLMTEAGIKLIDFDGCQSLQTSSITKPPTGTPGYRPPEFLTSDCKDLKSADIYSLGIVLFIMVTGTPPYSEIEENKKYTFDKYYEALMKDISKFWRVHEHYRENDNREPFSKEFKELIEGMLVKKPEDRLKLDNIKRSKWFEGKTFSNEELKRELRCHSKN